VHPSSRPRLRLRISRSSGRGTRLALAAIALLTTACGPGASSGRPSSTAQGAGPLRVVATTTVLADLVAQAGGDLVEVSSLVPKGGEVHTFDPTPADAERIATAQLIVMNGLGLDEWVQDLIGGAGVADVPVVELGEDLDGVEYLTPEEHDEEAPSGSAEEGHGHETANPHLWLNVAYAQRYVDRLVEALAVADPEDATAYRERAATYLQRLTDLDAWVRQQMASIPEANRRVISFHEAFPYFAAAYGLEVVGTVVDAPGQDPSAGEVAALIDAVRSEGVKAIFAEPQFPSDLTETIAQETGITVVTDLYNDSLGDPPVDTYEGLIRWDVQRVGEALR
jgi:manganese/iron transport system substrate-binding protein